MAGKLAGTAFACGVAGLPLALLSYAWLPFAWMGRDTESVRYAVIVAEVGALVAGALAIGLGVAARRRSGPEQPEYRRASHGLLLGAVVLSLVLVPNIVGSVLTAP